MRAMTILARLGSSILVAVTLCAATTVLAAGPPATRIRRAEALSLDNSAIAGSAALQKLGRTSRLRFEAFGRPFELELQSNEQILGRLPAANRALLPVHALYKGRLTGLPDSWLRLTRVGDDLFGAIWDGTELYAIAPAHALAGMLDVPAPADPATTMIYRATDVDSGLAAGFCAAVEPGERWTAAQQYEAVVDELNAPAAMAALVANRELAIGLIADTQFGQRFSDPQGAMLSRLNTVDGIYSSQVGVGIVATELRVLSDNGGLVATDAGGLLAQLADYRSATPELRSRGLSHLMTGRDLDGSTAGIAFVGSVCGGSAAASLSQQGSDPWIGALVTAHEIGHNFGALHDGESDSPCASTPQTFLMAPSLNGSSTFSQCSLDSIAPTVQSVSCLTATGVSDIELEALSSTADGYARRAADVAFDVVSVGNLGVPDVAVTLASDTGLQILDATVPDGSCTIGGGSASCQLGLMPAGARRRIDVRVQGDAVGTYAVTATTTSVSDQNAANNTARVSVALAVAADGALTFEPATLSATEGQTTRVSVLLTTSGIEPLNGVSVRVAVPADSLAVIAAAAEGGSCTTAAGQISCVLGGVPAAGTRRVDLDLRGTRSAVSTLEASVEADNDDDASNDRATATLNVVAVVSTSGGKSGGGGAIDFGLALALLALVVGRRCATRSQGGLHPQMNVGSRGSPRPC